MQCLISSKTVEWCWAVRRVYDPSVRSQSETVEGKKCNGPLVLWHLNLQGPLIISNNFIGRQVGARPTMCGSADGEKDRRCTVGLPISTDIITESLASSLARSRSCDVFIFPVLFN